MRRSRFTAPGSINLEPQVVRFLASQRDNSGGVNPSINVTDTDVDTTSSRTNVSLNNSAGGGGSDQFSESLDFTVVGASGSARYVRGRPPPEVTDAYISAASQATAAFGSEASHLLDYSDESSVVIDMRTTAAADNSGECEARADDALLSLSPTTDHQSPAAAFDYESVLNNTNSHNNMSDRCTTTDETTSQSSEGAEVDEDETSLFGGYPPSSFVTDHSDSMTAIGLNRVSIHVSCTHL